MRSRLSAGTKKADFGVVGVATYIPTHLRSGRRFEEMEIGVKFHSVTTLARTNEKEFNLITFIVKESVAALFIWIQWWKSPALVKASETGMSVTGIDMEIILLFWFGFCNVLFQFLRNLQQYCDSAYNKLNSLQQKEFIDITKINYIWKKKKMKREKETNTHALTHARAHEHTHARTRAHPPPPPPHTHTIPN